MSISIREFIVTIKTNQREQPPVTQARPEARQRIQEQGQDALVREAVEQTLAILKTKKER